MLSDFECEQALISNLMNYGFESYHDVATIGLSENSFSNQTHKIVFKCLHYLFEVQNTKNIDIPLIISAAKGLGYERWIVDQENKDYLNDLLNIKTNIDNAKKFGKKLRKLEVANIISRAVDDIREQIQDVTGEETLGDIFGIVENKLADLSGFLTGSADEPIDVASAIDEHLQFLADNPVDQLGLPTGFPIFDKCIGGGLRKHAITVIGARPKCGKSTMCKNMGYNIAKQGIPVLYLDTEMQTEDQMNRLLSSVSGVSIDDIESGKFSTNIIQKQAVAKAADEMKGVKFQHKNISGQSIESQLAIVRKWLIRDVGLDKDGRAKDCLLVYDYIKIMDGKDLGQVQEYQALGFLMTALQNFAVKYDIPVLTAVQLNRDGISVEDTSAIGGSDRIAMYGSSISILKWKTEEELGAEGYKWGNQKLVPLISRYGPSMEMGDFINISFNGSTNAMSENGTRANSQNDVRDKENASWPSKKSNDSQEVESNKDNDYDLIEF